MNCHDKFILRFVFWPVKVRFRWLSFSPIIFLSRLIMKMTVSGVQRMAGTSKAGALFDMCQIIALVPIEAASGKISINGAGFKAMELPLDPLALPQFMNAKFPGVFDLEMEPRPRNGRLETVVVGIAAAKAA